jgi:regulator of nucleoside diphosphate kinase
MDMLRIVMRKGDSEMTDRQMRNMISHAIAAARPIANKYYHVCWWDEAVQCHHARHTTERHEVFFSAPGSVLSGELSAVQWRLMINRIADFCRRRGIVLDIHAGRGRQSATGRTRRRWVTEYDSARLHALLGSVGTLPSERSVDAYRQRLERLLRAANVVAPSDVPEDVVTMNSQVRLRNEAEDIETDLFLVFPADARGSDVMKPKVSIFTQTGLSMLGRRVGDQINDRLRILDLPYQPEAAGDFEL